MGNGRTSHRRAIYVALLAALFTLAIMIQSHGAFAQGIITGSIGGSVTDQTGAVIPNATITAVNDSSKFTLLGRSGSEGEFFISNVPIGTYTLTIEAAGFGKSGLKNVQVAAGNTSSVGRQTLAPSGTAETVQVEAGAAELMNIESSQAEVVIDTAQIQTLPVSGAFDNATLMVPGVVQTHMDAFSNTNGVNYSVNGQRGRSNNSEIDGQTNNDNSIGGPSFFFSNQDALQELQVVTSDMGAQYGRNMGAVVNYITKQGTNTFHGSGFEYYLGSWGSSLLQTQKDTQYGFCPAGQSQNCLSDKSSPFYGYTIPTVPRFVENLWGGTLGGPILKDKLFFFGSTFWAHEYQAGALDTSGASLFPDATGLKELQADFPNNTAVAGLVAIGPYSNSQGSPAPVPGTTTQVAVSNGTTADMIEMSAVQRYLDAHVLDQEHLGRIDYDMTSKDRFYLRYAYQNNPWIPAWYLYGAATIAGGGYSAVTGITHEVGGDWTHIFTPSITNQLRYAFQQSKIGFEGGSLPTCTFADFSDCTSTVALGTGAEGFGYGGAFPQGRDVKVNQVQDNANWIKGRHTIQFGGEFDHQDSPNFGLPNVEGNFNFQPGLSGLPLNYPTGSTAKGAICSNNACQNGFTGMLEGIGLLSLSQGNTTVPYTEPDGAFYFQDDWKVLSNLTLNLGLRYEYFGQAVNLLHKESFAQQTGSHPFWSTSLPLSATTYPSVNPNYRNIEPRVGLAYIPSFAQKMVVHAGFSINVDPAFYNIFLNAAQSAPLVNANTVVCNGTTVNCEPSGGFTYSAVQSADTKYLPTGGDPRVIPQTLVPQNFKNPMAETYTLGVQYQVAPAAVWEVRYVGSHTFGQFQSLNTNPDIADVQSAFPNYGTGISPCTNASAAGYKRPDCNYDLVDTVGNTAFDIYNSLQTSLTVRNFHHLTGTASYTYSRAISNTSEIFSTFGGGNTNAFGQNPLNPDVGERGVDGNSYPNLWGIQLAYNEPWFSKQNGILGRLLGGYFINSFYQFNGGQAFNPFQADSMESPNVKIPSSSPTVISDVTTNFCDAGFASNFGAGGALSQCRPILDNKSAPTSAVGINVGGGVYEDYVTGTVAPRSSFHWLWNNKEEAMALGNPFPGVGRNILRGDSFNNVDASVGKNVKATERVSLQFTMNVFNVLNRAYYGTPDANLEDSLYPDYGLPNSFLLNTFTGGAPGTSAGGGAYYAGFGNRNIQLSAHVNF
jgi:hypothetical protein